ASSGTLNTGKFSSVVRAAPSGGAGRRRGGGGDTWRPGPIGPIGPKGPKPPNPPRPKPPLPPPPKLRAAGGGAAPGGTSQGEPSGNACAASAGPNLAVNASRVSLSS